MIKLAIDMMGGDLGILENIKSIDLFLKKSKKEDIKLYLVGSKTKLSKYINNPKIEIIDTNNYLDMGIKDLKTQFKHDKSEETPINEKSSMYIALDLVNKGVCDAVVSSGPTQGLVFYSRLIIRTLPETKTAALTILFKNQFFKGKVMLDIGANIGATPQDLVQYSKMGIALSKALFQNNNPLVGLLNIGTEKGKGRTQEVETDKLLTEDLKDRYFGYVEPKELFKTNADVITTDAFTGNIVLKTIEGTLSFVKYILKKYFLYFSQCSIYFFYLLFRAKKLKKQLMPKELTGSMILGLNKLVIKAHGSSNYKEFLGAIYLSIKLINNNIIEKVEEELRKNNND